jgi:glycosyltransferase involved in cell wall biosynthesis
MARGKYLALCDGDDYWIDPEKLKKQVEYLEKNEQCTLCFSNGIVDYNGGRQEKRRTVIPWSNFAKTYYNPSKTDYTIEDLVRLDFIPTSSLVVRKGMFLSMPLLSPNCFQGDQYIWLYNTSKGYAHYSPVCSCAYRRNVSDSITESWRRMKVAKNEIHPVDKSFLALYDAFNGITNFKYKSFLEIAQIRHLFEFALTNHDISFLRNPLVKDFAIKSGVKATIKYYLAFIPPLYSLVLWSYQKLSVLVSKTFVYKKTSVRKELGLTFFYEKQD